MARYWDGPPGDGRALLTEAGTRPDRLLVVFAAAAVVISIAAVAFALKAPAAASPPDARESAATLRCTNAYSGTTWDVAIDRVRRTADSFPAEMTDASIAWHDALRGGHYEFERATGELTVAYASSTGGFFLKDTCRYLPRSDR